MHPVAPMQNPTACRTHLLAAVDRDGSARGVLARAVASAADSAPASLHVLSILEPGDSEPVTSRRQWLEGLVLETLDGHAASGERPDLLVELHLREGEVEILIPFVASLLEVELVVLGSAGGGIARRAAQLVERIACPLLIHRSKDWQSRRAHAAVAPGSDIPLASFLVPRTRISVRPNRADG
jgi:hypothetical protein